MLPSGRSIVRSRVIGGYSATIPKVFLPEKSGSTYGDILKTLKLENPKVLQETASYRIATDGDFVHRMIETEGVSFFFRNRKLHNNEKPYAIVRNLRN